MNTKNVSQKGQILIIVMLIMITVSLVVLGVAARSITDIGISSTQDHSSQAFSAAESGVEDAIIKIRQSTDNGDAIVANGGSLTLPNGSSSTYTVKRVPDGTSPTYLSTTGLNPDVDVFQVYLYDPKNPSTQYNAPICILWGTNPLPSGQKPPAMEVSLIYESNGTFASSRAAFDDPTYGRTATNNFYQVTGADPSCPTSISAANNNLGVNRNFLYSKKIDYSNFPDVNEANLRGTPIANRLLRIKLLYNNDSPHYVGVSVPSGVSANLLTQGYQITSTGKVGTVTRKVQVYQTFASLPGIFDYVLFNGSGNLSKQ